jgi:hypothetical protein
MGRIEQVEHGVRQGEQRKGPHASRLGPALVRFELLEGEPEEQRQTQKKRQVGEQWQRSSKRQWVSLRNLSIGLQPQPDKTAGRPNSLPIADDRDPMDPAKPLGHLGK